MLYLEDKLSKTLKTIHIPYCFGMKNEYDDDENINELNDIFYTFTKNLHCHINYGATKAVICFDNRPYVIKIPFNGSYDEEWYGDDEEPQFNWTDFLYANLYDTELSEWDYCEIELQRYLLAEKAGFKNFFPKTAFIGYFNDYPFYIQEKGKPFNEYNNTKISVESYKKATKSQKCKRSSINIAWIALAIEVYGLKRTEEFITFAEKNNFTEDLHINNLGVSIDNKPILLDWAGFND